MEYAFNVISLWALYVEDKHFLPLAPSKETFPCFLYLLFPAECIFLSVLQFLFKSSEKETKRSEIFGRTNRVRSPGTIFIASLHVNGLFKYRQFPSYQHLIFNGLKFVRVYPCNVKERLIFF